MQIFSNNPTIENDIDIETINIINIDIKEEIKD